VHQPQGQNEKEKIWEGKKSGVFYSQSLKESVDAHAFTTQFVIFLGKKARRYPQAHKSDSENSVIDREVPLQQGAISEASFTSFSCQLAYVAAHSVWWQLWVPSSREENRQVPCIRN